MKGDLEMKKSWWLVVVQREHFRQNFVVFEESRELAVEHVENIIGFPVSILRVEAISFVIL